MFNGSGSAHNQAPISNQYREGILTTGSYSPANLEPGPAPASIPSVPVQCFRLQTPRTRGSLTRRWATFWKRSRTHAPSSDWDTDLLASDFFRGFDDYNFRAAEVGADSQQLSPEEAISGNLPSMNRHLSAKRGIP